MVPVHRTSQSLPGQGGQDLDWTLDFDLQSNARLVSDQILQPDRSTNHSHCPRRMDAPVQTRIPGRASRKQTREQGGFAREAVARGRELSDKQPTDKYSLLSRRVRA
ncbi:MAG: hypothetical protein GY696_35475 [Gammaproteobacteria bacterium]|nr:hypothetical protein [Gammaproteobacteria bacterium]